MIGNKTFSESHAVENRVSSTGISFTNGSTLYGVKGKMLTDTWIGDYYINKNGEWENK